MMERKWGEMPKSLLHGQNWVFRDRGSKRTGRDPRGNNSVEAETLNKEDIGTALWF